MNFPTNTVENHLIKAAIISNSEIRLGRVVQSPIKVTQG